MRIYHFDKPDVTEHNPIDEKDPVRHDRDKKIPHDHDSKQYREKGKYPRRVWPTDQEKHKGPKK